MRIPSPVVFLMTLCALPLQAWDNEQALRNQLNIARNTAGNMRERVVSSEKEVKERKKIVSEIKAKLTDTNQRLQRTREMIEAKSRAQELVGRQLNRKIKKLENDLQTAVDNGKSSDVLLNIQKKPTPIAKLSRRLSLVTAMKPNYAPSQFNKPNYRHL